MGLSAASLKMPPQKDKKMADVRIALLSVIVAAPIAPMVLGKLTNSKGLQGLTGAGLLLGELGLAATQVALIEK